MLKLCASAGAALVSNVACSKQPALTGLCSQIAGRRMRWIVPFPTGGGYDIYSRMIEPYLSKKVGAEIVVQNIPGAGGIVAANTLTASAPDGLTIGILNAPGLLASSLTGEEGVPNSATDFTILGRIVRNRTVFFAGPKSKFQSFDDVLAEARKRPILFSISEIGSTNFTNIALVARLLGIEVEYISGFPGSRATLLAVLRDEVDLGSISFESVIDQIESDGVRPLLQCGKERFSPHPSLEGVPMLGGSEGLAARRALELGRDVEEAIKEAEAIERFIGAGIVVAAPPRLNAEAFECLEEKLHETLSDPAFLAAAAQARRSLDAARAAEAHAEIRAAVADAERFAPTVKQAIEKVRS